MGFAIAGYPTRRRRGQKQRQVKLVKYDTDGNKKRKVVTHEKVVRISEMPVEIIQRIFVTSGNAAMFELNRFFHAILSPSDSLLSHMIWENYIWDPVQWGIFNEDEHGKRILLMLDNVFHVGVMRQYISHNLGILNVISRFMPVSIYEEFMSGRNDGGKIIEWWKQEAPTDFPPTFYNCPELFAHDSGFIRLLSRFFILKDPYILIGRLIRWFYKENNHHGKEILFQAIALVLETAQVEDGDIHSSEPLETLIHVLFIEDKNKGEVQVLTNFLNLFYSRENAREHLSDASLWQLLRSTYNMTVIDIVANHGGRPNYGAFLVDS